MPAEPSPLLDVIGLTVRFGGHIALNDVHLTVAAGGITGLIGPNGAGKTTFFNAVCGVLTPSGGRITFDGRIVNRLATHRRARLGIARTFQRLEVFGSLTARENVLVGAEIRRGWAGGESTRRRQLLSGGGDVGDIADEVDLIVDRLGLRAVAGVRAGELPTGQARLVELGRALATRPRLLLLDEPASGLDDAETAAFGELLAEMAGAGLGILLVEHDVPLVMRVCDRISVFDFGQVLASGTAAEVQSDPAVLDAYLGTAGAA